MKKRTYLQPQFDKAEKEIKESKDRIITTGKIIKAEISYIGGEKAEGNSYLPTNEHPFDHLLCQVTIERKWSNSQIKSNSYKAELRMSSIP